MEFVAVTKTGIHIYDAFSKKTNGLDKEDGDSKWQNAQCEPIFSLPAATNADGYVSTNAEGYAWSSDGAFLATVDKGTVVVWDARHEYQRLCELPPVGSSGGTRALRFSPSGSFLTTYEKHDKDKCPENMQMWDLREMPSVKRLRSHTLKGYSSGAVPVDLIQWSSDDSVCLELVPGEGLVFLGKDLQPVEPRTVVPEPHAARFQLAPKEQSGAYYVSCYVPEGAGRGAEVAVYHLSKPSESTVRLALPKKLKDTTMSWNLDGSALLALASSDVDETGSSYFGTTSLFWLRPDGKGKQQICGPEDGLVQDFAWSPNANEFLVIVGMLPATVSLYEGKSGKHQVTLGKSRRNTIRWSPFGRFLVVGGFGALPGDVDFFDRSCQETVCSFRAALTVNCCWSPDGRHFLTCTTAPRMNEDNQVSIFRYTSERLLKIDFKPANTGAGKKLADAAAMLFAASWRPNSTDYKDMPATPRDGGPKRPKGLPSETAAVVSAGAAESKVGAYRPAGARGGGASSIAAMMRGEVDVLPAPAREERWGDTTKGEMTHEEIKAKLKEQKEAEKKERLAKEEAARLANEAALKTAKRSDADEKKLERLKKELEALEGLKDKAWDELTSDDEAELEKELDLRSRIAVLEKKVGPA